MMFQVVWVEEQRWALACSRCSVNKLTWCINRMNNDKSQHAIKNPGPEWDVAVKNKRESSAVGCWGVMATADCWEADEWQKGFWFLFTWCCTWLQWNQRLCGSLCIHALLFMDYQWLLFYRESGTSLCLKVICTQKTIWTRWLGVATGSLLSHKFASLLLS